MGNLSGKVALVTGGSRGIGAAIAERLAREGADVAISYASAEDKAKGVVHKMQSLGVRALAVRADQGNPQEAAALIQQVRAHFGRLDILVNSAGIFVTGVIGDPDADIEALNRQWAVNMGGVVAAVRAAVPVMADGGRIISIGTTGATRAPFAGIADYVATKAAVAAYTRGWARDLGSRQITVNIVQPGAIDTDMNPSTAAHAPRLSAMAALGSYGKPEDIAGAVAFLAGPDGNYITGATLNVDGGQLT